MSGILLDTHVFLWFLQGDHRLPPPYRDSLGDPATALYLSMASLWEIAIKSQLKKLDLGMAYDAFVQQNVLQREVTVIPIEVAHLSAYASLPLHHRDPFDRLIIAQATTLGVPVVTGDPNYTPYPIEVLWEHT